MKIIDYVLLTLVIIGAINWGLIGFIQFSIVVFAVYILYKLFKLSKLIVFNILV